ncbi:MAG: transposase [Promethearchaeota archaeon]
MEKAGFPLNSIFDQKGGLRIDKLELLFRREKQGKRDWKLYNECKPILIGLKYAFVDIVKTIYYDELASINYKKNGRWYDYPPSLMALVVIIKLVDNCPYRKLAKELSLILRPELDIHIPFSTLSRRMSKINIGEFLKGYLVDLTIEEIKVAVDSTGLTLNNHGKWHETKHGTGTRNSTEWVKFHIMVISGSHISIAYAITPNGIADCQAFYNLFYSVKKDGFKIVKLDADKAYDVKDIYNKLTEAEVLPAILPRKGSISKSRGCPFRRDLVRFIQDYSEQIARTILNTKDRLSAERYFAVFKALFTERVYSRVPYNIFQEEYNEYVLSRYYLSKYYLAKNHLIQLN